MWIVLTILIRLMSLRRRIENVQILSIYFVLFLAYILLKYFVAAIPKCWRQEPLGRDILKTIKKEISSSNSLTCTVDN